MIIRLWTINRALRWVGLSLTIKHPSTADVPTLIAFNWIGWRASARAAADLGRGAASGYERDEEGELRYIRCVAASDAAWDKAVAEEYSS